MGQPVSGDILKWNGTKGVYTTPPPTTARLMFTARKYNIDTATNIPRVAVAVSNTYIGLAPAGDAETLVDYNVSKLVVGSTPTLTGMDGSTGIWTVPSSGFYLTTMSAFLRANPDNNDANVEIGDFGDGYMSFAIMVTGSPYTECLLFRKERTIVGPGGTYGTGSTTLGRTSFINIRESQIDYLIEGAQYHYKILNNTELEYEPEAVNATSRQSVTWQVIKLD